MLHICFDDSAYFSIRQAMKLALIEKGKVIAFNDDLSVGDLSNCSAYESRKTVIHNIFYHYEITEKDELNLKKEFNDFYEMLANENDFIIWYSHNPRDYCNLYYLVSLLQHKNICVVQCTEKTLGDKTFFYQWVDEVCIEDLPLFFKNIKTLSEEEQIIYTNKWNKLVTANGLLRAESYGELCTVPESYYDHLILKTVPLKNIFIAQVVGDFIGMSNPYLRDWFVVWRIKKLVARGFIEIEKTYLDQYMFNNIKKVI